MRRLLLLLAAVVLFWAGETALVRSLVALGLVVVALIEMEACDRRGPASQVPR